MSGGANIKALSQSRNDTGVTSSLPLPQNMMPLPKMDPKQQKSSIPNPTVQYQHSERRQSAYSSSSASSGPANLLKGSTLKNHLLQQKTSTYYHRGSTAAGRTDGVSSSYSSPRVPKREAPRSKDTLDLCNSTLTQRALRDLQLRRHSNKNWTFGKYRQRNVENACQGDTLHRLTSNPQWGQGRGRLLYSKSLNGNETSVVSSSGLENFHKDARKSQEMGNPLEETVNRKRHSSHQTFNMARRSSEPAKVNMAAVAPFRFRFQVDEDAEAAADNLSDCSSDSMEVCCDDLDPESQRKRTVQNVLDLRQNLEDTMSSLRGSQLSHSCLDSSNVGYDSDETNARSISSMSNRSSPLSWRHGQSSPRLQAGDAPSSTGSGFQGGKSASPYTAHTMPARCSSHLSSSSRIELIENLDVDDLKSGYMSDNDLQAKTLPDDDDDVNLDNGIARLSRRTLK